MTIKTAALKISLIDDVSKPARTVAQAMKDAEARLKDVGKAMAGTGASDKLVRDLSKLKLSAKDIDTVKTAWRDYAKTAGLAGSASAWTKTQAADVKRWEAQTLASIRAVRRERAAEAREMARRERAPTAWQTRRSAAGALIGGYAASKAGSVARNAIDSVVDFDIALRQQKVFMDLGQADQAKLKAQALKIGQETKFTNLDVVHAQTAAMQGMGAKATPAQKAQVAMGMTSAASNFAQMMPGTDLTQSAELIRSYMSAFGQDMSDVATAVGAARDAANVMLKTAKSGGMSFEDLQGYVKFAGASANAAGIKPETAMALAAVSRIGGLRGDEAGVFMRTAANKLTSPTNKGRAALAAAGLNYDDYVGKPDAISASGLEGHMARKLGRKFDPATAAAVQKVLADKDALGSMDKFVPAMVSATEGVYGKTKKKGGYTEASLNKIAKAVGEFYSLSQGKVDSERLLNDIFSEKMSYQQASAFFTDKHGGKAMISQSQFEEVKAIVAKLQAMKNDPDFAKRGAEEIQGGVGGAVNQAKGSLETFFLKLGEANEGLIRFIANVGGDALDKFSNASQGVQQLGTAAGAAAAAFGAYKAGGFLKDMVTGGGASAALNGSAASLTGAATALEAAALKLGASPMSAVPSGGAPGAPGAPVAPGAGLGGAVSLLAWPYVKDMTDKAFDALPQPKYPAGYDPKAELNKSLWDRVSGVVTTLASAADRMQGVAPERKSGALPTFAAAEAATPHVDATQIRDAAKAADEAKAKVEGLNVTAKPTVDSSDVDALNAKIDKARAGIRALGGEIGAVAAKGASLGAGLPSLARGGNTSFRASTAAEN